MSEQLPIDLEFIRINLAAHFHSNGRYENNNENIHTIIYFFAQKCEFQ